MATFFEWLTRKVSISKSGEKEDAAEISCSEIFAAAQEYALRELAFWICVDTIANALGKCEFKTYLNDVEVRDAEAYLWNIEPNINQNSTAFLHKLVARLYLDNEVLIISTKGSGTTERLAIADSYSKSGDYPSRENEYTGVTIGDFTYNKTFRESEVMHLTLNNKDIKKVLDAMYASYNKLIDAAQKHYTWTHGQHWKVHVEQMAQGADGWEEQFQRMMEAQIKPFLQADGAILPEFDGYTYSDAGQGGGGDTRDIRAMYDDIFDFTARTFGIPTVLLSGEVAGTSDAFNRWLTLCIDPLCDQLQEEINRKRYGFAQWRQGNYLRIDTSSLIHFDLFANAANVDKLISSGAFSVNEVRRAAGQIEINEDWADRHMITKNYATITDALDTAGGGE